MVRIHLGSLISRITNAIVAQLEEQMICNHQVAGSIPVDGSMEVCSCHVLPIKNRTAKWPHSPTEEATYLKHV